MLFFFFFFFFVCVCVCVCVCVRASTTVSLSNSNRFSKYAATGLIIRLPPNRRACRADRADLQPATVTDLVGTRQARRRRGSGRRAHAHRYTYSTGTQPHGKEMPPRPAEAR